MSKTLAFCTLASVPLFGLLLGMIVAENFATSVKAATALAAGAFLLGYVIGLATFAALFGIKRVRRTIAATDL